MQGILVEEKHWVGQRRFLHGPNCCMLLRGSKAQQLGIYTGWLVPPTVGGACVALAYVAQEAVQTFHWLRPGEMLDALGMAETTPGRLIIVTHFVGFMRVFRSVQGISHTLEIPNSVPSTCPTPS